MPRALLPLEDRLWKRVRKNRTANACWIWLGAKNSSGHGRIWMGEHESPRQRPAHCVTYELLVGPIPDGMHLDHLCQNPSCVNPKHLEPVTPWENLRRAPGTPARLNSEKTHCAHGHPYDHDNTYIAKRGSRHCRTCMRLKERRRRAEQTKRAARADTPRT